MSESFVIGNLASQFSSVDMPQQASSDAGLSAFGESLVGQTFIADILAKAIAALPGLVAQFVSKEQVLAIIDQAIDVAFAGRPFVKNAIKPIVLTIVGNVYDAIFSANPPTTEV